VQLPEEQSLPHKLGYQESLIQERETEIQEIESVMHEIAGIFRDLEIHVREHGRMIGVITRTALLYKTQLIHS
jgi:t-SNARE complex subunit (syntaxin)